MNLEADAQLPMFPETLEGPVMRLMAETANYPIDKVMLFEEAYHEA